MNRTQATAKACTTLLAAVEQSNGLPEGDAAELLHDAAHAVVILLRPFAQ